jgi:uncharacterized OB-fold protein
MEAELPQTSVPAARPFMPGLFEAGAGEERAVLLASRCVRCDRHFFPARATCSACGPAGEIVAVKLDGAGTIYSSTVSRVPSPTGLKPPYAYGYVDLSGAPLRVFALFTGAEPDGFRPGAPVEMVVEPLRTDKDGAVVLAHKFRLSGAGEDA